MTYWKDLKDKIKDIDCIKSSQIKYRCEQTIITKVNSIPTCTTLLKSDYSVEKVIDIKNSIMNVYCKLDDNITSIYPNQYNEALNMVMDLEKIKCNSVIDIDMDTGTMGRIINHDEVFNEWKYYCQNFKDKYKFLRSSETNEAVQQFVQSVDKIITDPKLLLADLSSKMFFMLIFDGYLVGKEEYKKSYNIIFSSMLFKDIRFPMTIIPIIQKESPNIVIFDRKSDIGKSVKKMSDIERIYDKQFKPTIGYKFSEYDARFNISERLHEDATNYFNNYIENAEAYIIEEIPNNVNLTIHCKLRKID